MTSAEVPELMVADGKAWRRWLTKNHADPTGVWLILATKGTTTPTALRYAEALEEALCFGWIDGQARRRDESTYMQRFTPRRARSRWSQRNVGLVGRLATEGRMLPSGNTEVERAKADSRWAAAYAGQAAAQMPEDLGIAISRSPSAQAMFGALTAQNRYALIHRVSATRSAETRAARVQQFVAMLERGETIHPQKLRPG
jgi:uncharacterized protein YdeI (YjbR/CyaY-like superfamily)